MKMRFWQRTYLFTLALFLFCFNAGILSLALYTHQKNVKNTEDAVFAEQYYVAVSFERDFEDTTQSGTLLNPSFLMEAFGAYYSDQGILLAFEEEGEILYSNFKNDIQVEKETSIHTYFDGKRHLLISSQICDGRFQMIFAKNVETLDVEFRSLMVTYALTAVAVSLVLAVCLYFILKKLSEPLEKLRKTTEVIEAGNFSVTAEEKGNDEFTLLAKSFNAMLKKIGEQMTALEREAEAKMVEAERKQMLVDNMAHELRTPLTSIHGYAEFIEKANTTEERRLLAAKYIVSEAERLQKISEILLDGALIRENEIEMTRVDLKFILSDVAEKLEMKAKKAQVEIFCEGESVTVKGNEILLSMLFYNLLENAIKACPAGGRVKLSCLENRATVEDDGKGMTEEQLSHVTEPFYRTDKSRSRAEGGAGLGLALCKQIVHTHGAEMHFSSEPGKGTRVSVIFTS